MPRIFPIGGRRLIGTRFAFQQQPFDEGTLFPFFDRQGLIQCLVVLSGQSAEVRLLDLAGGRTSPTEGADADLTRGSLPLRVPWRGTIRWDGQWEALPLLESADAMAGLWHYDPCWLMRRPLYRDHPLADALQRTNCIDQFSWVCENLYFDGRLQRVVLVSKAAKEGSQIIRFRAAMLPEPPPVPDPPQPPARRVWKLAPIWER